MNYVFICHSQRVMVLLPLFLFLFCVNSANAQGRYPAGYVVMKGGDTIFGYVVRYQGEQAFRNVKFKRTPKDEPLVYAPDRIKAYGYDNGISFRAARVRTYDRVNDINKERMMFLEVLNKGKLNLYYLNTSKKRFFIGGKRQMFELVNIKKDTLKGVNWITVEGKQYIESLNKLMKDCSTLDHEEVSFTAKGLSNQVEQYNLCSGQSDYVSPRPNMRSKIKKMVYVGLVNATVKGIGQAANFKDSEAVPGISFGFGLQIPFSAINDQGVVDLGLEYSHKESEADSDGIVFDRHYIGFGTGLSYFLLKKRISPFVGLGANLAVQLKSVDQAYTRISTSGREGPERKPLFASVDPSPVEIGVDIKTGIRYKINDGHALMGIVKYTTGQIPFNLGTQDYTSRSFSFQVAYVF